MGDHPLAAYYGANLGWLQAVKQQYDPRAFFSSNPLAIPIQPPPPAPPPGASPGPAAGTESAASLRPAVSQAMALPPPAAAPVAAAAAAPEPAPSSGAARAAQVSGRDAEGLAGKAHPSIYCNIAMQPAAVMSPPPTHTRIKH